MKIRPYQPQDKPAVMRLFSLNTPAFFALSEQEDLEKYLDHEAEEYFVVEDAGKIIGVGGINYFPEERTARLSWDIIAPDHQGKGIGKKLTEHRISRLNANSRIELIVVRTSQLAFRFYEKMGFTLTKTEKDFWAKGFDLYEMEMRKTPLTTSPKSHW